jgi:hypothetical protein
LWVMLNTLIKAPLDLLAMPSGSTLSLLGLIPIDGEPDRALSAVKLTVWTFYAGFWLELSSPSSIRDTCLDFCLVRDLGFGLRRFKFSVSSGEGGQLSSISIYTSADRKRL